MIKIEKTDEEKFKLPDGKEVTDQELLVWLANKILKIEKAVK